MPRSKRKRYINPTSIAVTVAMGVGLLLLVAVGLYRLALAPVSRDTRTKLVHIQSMGTKPLARKLRDEGLVRNATAFRLLVQSNKALGKSSAPKAGYYDLSPSMSSEEILARLCEGKVARRKVTFPEGFTVAQMAGRLEEVLDIPRAEFLAAARGARISRAVAFRLPKGRLEGYLFPSTYTFNVGEKPALIVGEMVASLNEVFARPYQSEIRRQKLTVPQLVTLASLIEREARVGQERPLIAGVIMNRLARGMRLQIDATVQYALGEHKSRLLYKDLRVNSPYNTYRHAGLPPGPICNPGLDCLLAALRPAKTDKLFYVAKPDGTHVFTKTYEEHLQAIQKVRR
ncbi:MAG: endolytic transglycosylase MltG [Armatimonadetes bacterium]|nr:endolytic transglycosylase MltG [Armatimonadota bacterium]